MAKIQLLILLFPLIANATNIVSDSSFYDEISGQVEFVGNVQAEDDGYIVECEKLRVEDKKGIAAGAVKIFSKIHKLFCKAEKATYEEKNGGMIFLEGGAPYVRSEKFEITTRQGTKIQVVDSLITIKGWSKITVYEKEVFKRKSPNNGADE